MRVVFGRTHGEQTEGTVVKKNDKMAKVKILEHRGRKSPAGTVWNVGYTLLRLSKKIMPDVPMIGRQRRGVEDTSEPMGTKAVLEYNEFSSDNPYLELIGDCYSGLSPENLSCDGEASITSQRQRAADLNRRLRGLQIAVGYNVTEEQFYEWDEARRDRKVLG